jgi:hypothetical protein
MPSSLAALLTFQFDCSQCALQMLTLHVIEVSWRKVVLTRYAAASFKGERGSFAQHQIAGAQNAVALQQHGAFQHVAQFAHIAGPVVGLERGHGCCRRAAVAGGIPQRQLAQEVRASTGMSPVRSRSGGIVIWNTLSRYIRSLRNLPGAAPVRPDRGWWPPRCAR